MRTNSTHDVEQVSTWGFCCVSSWSDDVHDVQLSSPELRVVKQTRDPFPDHFTAEIILNTLTVEV